MSIKFRKPVTEDGMAIHGLVELSPPLDANSAYCNLLQASYFSDTSIIADLDGELFGFITGFRAPTDPSTLFVWQVAVAPAARGMGLAGSMLNALVQRLIPDGVRYVQTTITKDNEASWALFKGFAKKQSVQLEHEPFYSSVEHFRGLHATEHRLTIGPIQAPSSAATDAADLVAAST